jgi:hypothetical protein
VIALVENNPRALQSNSAAVLGRFSDGNVPLNGRRKPRPTIEELREYLDYEPETGVLRWRKAAGTRAKAGAVAGYIGQAAPEKHYWKLRFRSHTMWAHRVAFALHHDRWPSPCCDHIDGNGLNNRIDNLRECSVSQNQQNRSVSSTCKTGIKGVWPHVKGGFVANASLFGKKYRKYFRRLEDAAAWAKQMREQLHGEFARH